VPAVPWKFDLSTGDLSAMVTVQCCTAAILYEDALRRLFLDTHRSTTSCALRIIFRSNHTFFCSMTIISFLCPLLAALSVLFAITFSAVYLALGWNGPLPVWIISLYVSWLLTALFSILFCALPEKSENGSDVTKAIKVLVFSLAWIAWFMTAIAMMLFLAGKVHGSNSLSPIGPVLGSQPKTVASIKGIFLVFHYLPGIMAVGVTGYCALVGLLLLFVAIHESLQKLDGRLENWRRRRAEAAASRDGAVELGSVSGESYVTEKQEESSYGKRLLTGVKKQLSRVFVGA